MDLLFLHAGGLGWDEALVVLGGLAVLTAVLMAKLRDPGEPVAEVVQPDQAAASADRPDR
jgi:hypothetical protein